MLGGRESCSSSLEAFENTDIDFTSRAERSLPAWQKSI